MPQPELQDFGKERANAILAEEAYRLVPVRDGDRVVRLPLIQAVFRAMGVAAAKGNRFAQRELLQHLKQIERENFQLRGDFIDRMLDYKFAWQQQVEDARRRGQPTPEPPLPHPDDVIIDSKSGDVLICGPRTAEEQAEWQRRLDRRDEAQDEINHYADCYRLSDDPGDQAMSLSAWHAEQDIFDTINDNMPVRYRTQLENRSWKEGASRPGSRRRVHWYGG